MKTSQKGFTLVELVVVIVLLGILGVTALGKFQDLSASAESAALDGVASELAAASAINFAASQLGTEDLTVASSAVCTGLGQLFATGATPSGYTFTDPAATPVNCSATQTTVTCDIEQDSTTNNVTVDILCTN